MLVLVLLPPFLLEHDIILVFIDSGHTRKQGSWSRSQRVDRVGVDQQRQRGRTR